MKLLEREIPLRLLEATLNEANAGEGRVVLVSGEAGIGKTSLVQAFVSGQRKTIRTLYGACDSLFTPRPLGPFLDIATHLQGELPHLLHAGMDRQTVFTTSFLEIRREPTILVIEDIHWADEATLDLVKFLCRRIQQTQTLFILTYRDDELGPEHPLRLVLGDLPHGVTRRVRLLPLSRSSVFELALATDQTGRASELFHTTAGNPFFVAEVLASRDETIPHTVRDMVLARAARLSTSARSVLEAAAVIGRQIEPWLLSKMVGPESLSIDECVAGGVLLVQDDHYAFRHELTRQAVLEVIPRQRKATLHRLALAALKESPRTSEDMALLANHAAGTGDPAAVLEFAPAAARQASSAGSHREAMALFELALRSVDSLPSVELANMLEAYASELWYASALADSINILKRAAELWHGVGDRLREGANLELLAQAFYLTGQKAEAEKVSQDAITLLEALPPSRELARAYKAQCFLRGENRDCAEAVKWGERAITLAEQLGDSETVARAANYAGCALMVIDLERGRALLERSLEVGRNANLPFSVAGALANLAQMLVELYEIVEAERILGQSVDYALEHDDAYHLHESLTWQAMVRFYQGHWNEAAEIIASVLDRRDLDFTTYTYAMLCLGRLQVRQGDPRAGQTLGEALSLSRKGNAIVRLGIARSALAEAAWLAGDLERAMDELRALYELALGKAHPWSAGELAFWRWRAGDEFSPPAWIGDPFKRQLAGNWRGAAAEWERRGCAYEQALALMDGDEQAQLIALEIITRLGAQPALEKLKQQMRTKGVRRIPRGPRSLTRENPFGLTAREMEVLALLVQGSTNRAIADELTLSTRTVEHHVASILLKMQVQSRNEAVVVALKDNLLPSK